jgi:phosphoribosylformimino-5-aminoimidazole carboxamide ribotide isomerase
MGTAAVLSPDVVRTAGRQHPDQIVLAIDVSHDRLMLHGRREESMFVPTEFVKAFEGAQLAGLLITDVEGDSMGSEGAMGRIAAIAGETRIPVIASGIVRTLDDVSRLNFIPDIAGAIIGRALFNRTVDLQEALASAVSSPERTAAFI